MLFCRVDCLFTFVLQLRKRNWVPRQDTNAPKTIKEVHKEAAEKEKEKEKDLRNLRNAPPPRMDQRGPPPSARGGGVGMPSMPGIYGPAPTSQRGGQQPAPAARGG